MSEARVLEVVVAVAVEKGAVKKLVRVSRHDGVGDEGVCCESCDMAEWREAIRMELRVKREERQLGEGRERE